MRRFGQAAEIKVGVIGYGGAFNMGRSHLNEMKRAGMTPVAVAEIDPARLKVAAGEFPGIETCSTVAAMLKKSDVNLITIITPHNTHARLATQCLRASKHVVCEKPLAITTAECDAMIAAARKSKVILSTYHNRHWDGCILEAVRQVRDKGVIGDVVRIEAHMGRYGRPGDWWRTSKSVSGGVLYDWGVHLLEYSLQLIDSKITEVSAHARTGFWAPKTAWKKDTNEDEGFAVVRFASGQWLTLCVTTIDSNPKAGQLEITGTKGSYVFDGRTWTLTRCKKHATTVTTGRNPDSEGWRFYQNIADHLVKREKLVITPEWSRRPIHILDLADRSIRKGAAVKAKYA
ncbi:MAG: Gfo/Idh/MocA family oxidoreductase [Phycisphaerae bacterium]|nr:Gfo/Idh/MocA family oxidoreductase [Phycisphaerae bacterium]